MRVRVQKSKLGSFLILAYRCPSTALSSRGNCIVSISNYRCYAKTGSQDVKTTTGTHWTVQELAVRAADLSELLTKHSNRSLNLSSKSRYPALAAVPRPRSLILRPPLSVRERIVEDRIGSQQEICSIRTLVQTPFPGLPA